jgi:hypothetical protein
MRGIYVTAVLMAGVSYIIAVTLALAYDSMLSLFNPGLSPISIRNIFLPIIALAGFNRGEIVPSIGVSAQNFL